MVDEEAAESQGWAYFADELGELHPCCPGCLAERFGIAEPVPASARSASSRSPAAAKLTGVPSPESAENRPIRARALF